MTPAVAAAAGRVWVKICGCMAPEDAAAAAACGADAVGFVLSPGFRRSLDPAAARRVRAAVPPGTLAVGVFVRPSGALVAEALAALRLDGVQLHGAGDLGRSLRGSALVIAAWDPDGPEPEPGEDAADLLHLEPGASLGGGRGRAWDWGRLALRRPAMPFVLAGGLTPETVAAACTALRPAGVDVSSGVESGGRKDPEKMARFCAEARRASAARAAGA